MARIKLYESQATAPRAGSPVTSGVRFSAADFSSKAIGAAIKQVSEVKQAYDKKAIQDERNQTEKFLADTRLNMTEQVASNMEESLLRGDGASGFTENLMDNFSDFIAENSKSGSDADNIYRKTQLTKLQAGLLGPAARFQAKEAGQLRLQTITTAQNSHMPIVYSDPNALNSAVEEMKTTVSRLGLTGQALEDQVKSSSNELGKMSLTGIIDRMTPKEANQLHDELINGKSEWLTKINGDDVDNMARYAKTRAAAATKVNAHNTLMFTNNLASATTAVNNGFPVNSETITQLSNHLDQMPDDATKVIAVKKFQNLIVTTKVVQDLKKMTIPAATAALAAYQATANQEGSNVLDVEVAIAAKNTVTKMQSNAKDPIQLAQSMGVIKPVDVNYPESLEERGIAARKFSSENDVEFKMFSVQELVSITNAFESMPPLEQAQLANRIVESAGSDAIPVMAEFKKINPHFAVMGALKATDPSAHNFTIQTIAKGADLSEKNELMAGLDYKEVMIGIRQKLQKVLLETGGDNLAAYTKAAMAFYLGKGGTAQKNVMGQIDADDDLVKEAINSVLGHPTTDGNQREAIHEVEAGDESGEIVLPFDVTGENFDDAIEFINDDDLLFFSETGGAPVYKGARITAENLREGSIIVVDNPLSQLKPGEIAYAFRDGDGHFVQDDTGKIFHLVLSAEILDKFMSRKIED